MTQAPDPIAAGKTASEKTAIVLFNLGSPAQEKDIRPFLFNFFRDRHIITLPNPLRFLLACWIAWSRGRGAARAAYRQIGGKSPLLGNTRMQAWALEQDVQKHHPQARVFIAMRHWHPLAAAAVKEVAAFQPDKIVLLPLYPQYSTTTTLSALENWKQEAKKAGLTAPTQAVCCYPADEGFIAAGAALIQAALKELPKKTRVLFSAHGLPEKIIRAGDPYQLHCEKTVEALLRKLDTPLLDWQICYQSRIGRLPWIGPSIDEALERAADDKVSVVVYPIAFVSEHVETLVELDREYRDRAAAMGIQNYVRVPTVGTHPAFIDGLCKLVLSSARGDAPRTSCDASCGKCFYKVKHV